MIALDRVRVQGWEAPVGNELLIRTRERYRERRRRLINVTEAGSDSVISSISIKEKNRNHFHKELYVLEDSLRTGLAAFSA